MVFSINLDSAIIEYQVLKEPVKEPKKKVVYTAEEKRIYKEKKRLELLKQESNASNDKEIQVQEPEKVQVTTTTSSKPRKIKRRQSKKQLVEPAYEPDSIQPEYVEPTALVEGPIVRQKSNVSFAENVDDNEKPYFKRIPKEKRYYSKKPSLSDVSAAVA